jgi:hypothetical protein
MTKDTIAVVAILTLIGVSAIVAFKEDAVSWHNEPPVMPSTTLDATK